MFTLIRSIHHGDEGPDVLALKRALKAAKVRGAVLMVMVGPGGRKFGSSVDRCLRTFQREHGQHADGVLGPDTFNKLRPYVDRYGISLFERAPRKTPEEETFAKLLSVMHAMTEDTPGYLLGGGHGQPLSQVSYFQHLDCSSSCSKALFDVGLFGGPYAWVSGQFAASYGLPGEGELFTIYANGDHVWIRLKRGPYWRFDTSPQGDSGSGRNWGFGPQLRRMPRFTFGFTARHAARF